MVLLACESITHQAEPTQRGRLREGLFPLKSNGRVSRWLGSSETHNPLPSSRIGSPFTPLSEV